jgi:hypothetical protein
LMMVFFFFQKTKKKPKSFLPTYNYCTATSPPRDR